MYALQQNDDSKSSTKKGAGSHLTQEDKFNLGGMRQVMGMGAPMRYAHELWAAKQPVGRLAPLQSSHLQEEVLRGHLAAGNLGRDRFNLAEDIAPTGLKRQGRF